MLIPQMKVKEKSYLGDKRNERGLCLLSPSKSVGNSSEEGLLAPELKSGFT